MSSGIDAYWRMRRRQEEERKIRQHLLDVVYALLYNTPTNRILLKRVKAILR